MGLSDLKKLIHSFIGAAHYKLNMSTYAQQKKGAATSGIYLKAVSSVGIKNSWKYEKDLIIFNIISVIFTITRLADMIILYRLIKNNRKSMLFCMNLKKQKINLNE